MSTFSWKDIVEEVEDDEDILAYEFSGGRKFYYDENSGPYSYTVVDGEIVE